jgi:ABC-2 type transport system permease protein
MTWCPFVGATRFALEFRLTDVASRRAESLSKLDFEVLEGRRPGLFRGTVKSIVALFHQHELIELLVRRELKVRYKDSSLGFLWTLVRPITLLLVYYFAIGVFLGASRNIPSFAIYVFSGLTLWALYSDMLVGGTVSVYNNANLIRKVYLPREVFPISAVGSALFNFAVQFGVLLLAMLVLGQFPVTWDLLYIFPAAFIVILFGAGFAILLSALNVFLRDVAYLVEVAILVLFWASPIVYSWLQVSKSLHGGWLAYAYLYNPITPAILAFQKATWFSGPAVQAEFAKTGVRAAQIYPENLNWYLLGAILLGVVFLWFAHRIFGRLEGSFAQEI